MPSIDTHLRAQQDVVQEAAQQAPVFVDVFADVISNLYRMPARYQIRVPEMVRTLVAVPTSHRTLAHRCAHLLTRKIPMPKMPVVHRIEVLCLLCEFELPLRTVMDVTAGLQQHIGDVANLWNFDSTMTWRELIDIERQKVSQVQRRLKELSEQHEGMDLDKRSRALPMLERNFYLSAAAWLGESQIRAGQKPWTINYKGRSKSGYYAFDFIGAECVLRVLELGFPVRNLERILQLMGIDAVLVGSRNILEATNEDKAAMIRLLEEMKNMREKGQVQKILHLASGFSRLIDTTER